MDINGYLVKEEWFLGRGSFGAVYKALKNDKYYAIKRFQTDYVKSELGRKLVEREIDCLRKINHPSFVKLYEFGSYKDGGFEYFYLVMDYVEGITLDKKIGLMKEIELLSLFKNILKNLDIIHQAGIVHRDLKPSNVILRSDGTPVILDFGLSKIIDYSSIAQTGQQVGTYHYMSPEQITDSKHIDKLSDYFALGIIFYQLSTGILPYDATNIPALIEQIKNEYPKVPSDLNPEISNMFENVLLKLLEKQPHRRFQSTHDILNAVSSTPQPSKKLIGLSQRFYVKLLHNEKAVISEAITEKLVEEVIFPANFYKGFKPTLDVLEKSKIIVISDPATNRLPYSAFSKTVGVKELPYSSGDAVIPIHKKDFSSISQIQGYVKKVLTFQISNKINQLCAPFFYARGIDDDWFNINLKLLRESITYRDEHFKGVPLWGGICMNVSDWHDDDVKNKILNRYVRWAPDGYMVYGDPISNKADLPSVFHYADLLLKLQDSAGIPVVACRVGGLGTVLLSIGLAGVASGISSLDSFDEKILSDEQEGYKQGTRYYIPELFSFVSLKKGIPTKIIDIQNTDLKDVLKCKCKYCDILYSKDIVVEKNTKLHYLYRKKQELEEIKKLSPQDKIKKVVDDLNNAIKYEKYLRSKEIKILNDASYLKTWRDLALRFIK